MKTKTKKITSIFLTFAMLVTMLGAFSFTASAAEGVSYVDREWNGTEVVSTTKTVSEYTTMTSETVTMTDGWYVVNSDLTFDTRLTVTGTVHLILADGATLTANQGISVNEGHALYIYGQSDDESNMGKLVANSNTYNFDAMIGGDEYNYAGKLVFNGGFITATSTGDGAAIGSGYNRAGYDIVIQGGVINVAASHSSAAIGSGDNGGSGTKADLCSICIHGGTVSAEVLKNCSATIGGGYQFDSGDITITGGSVTATNATWGAAIGGGGYCSGGNITITGGTVVAKNTDKSSQCGAGIGGGYQGSGGNITITGGNVTAVGGWGAAGIGGYANAGNIVITGGTIDSTGNVRACGIGGGVMGVTGSIAILTDNLTIKQGSSGKGDVGFGEDDDGTGATMLLAGTTVTVSGDFTLRIDYTLPAGYTLEIPEGATLTIPEGIKLNIDGTIVNNGTINCYSHTYKNGICVFCEDVCTHAGDATCKTAANCTICGMSFIDASNHEQPNEFTCSLNASDNTKHDVKYACCNSIVQTDVHTAVYSATSENVITETCSEDCGYSATATLTASDAAYTGAEIAAAYISYSDGWMGEKNQPAEIADTKYTDNLNVGTATVTTTVEGYEISTTFNVTPKELSLTLTSLGMDYNGTNILTNYEVKLDGIVIYDEGSYVNPGILDFDDVYDDVMLDTDALVVTLPGCTAGRYTTATISNIKLIGEDAANYTIAEELVVENVDIEISPMPISIIPMDQVVSEGQDIDPDAYDLDKELPEGHILTGVQLAVDEEHGEIYVAMDENENIVGLKVTNAKGEDVTNCFNFHGYETGKLTRTHQGHSFNADGFCATGECSMYQPANAGTNEWGETVYEIGNAGQLYWFAELVNVDGDQYASGRLVNNIVIPAGAPNWVPIGGYSEWISYTGAFDGQGHTISGLKCETTGKYAGLFGYTDYNNTIQNIGILNSSFKGTQYVGGLIGCGYTTVTNCYMANTTVEGTDSTMSGFMGYNGGYVSNCFAYADTLVGHNSGTVENSYYLSDTETEEGGKTAAQFASGEMVYLLGEAWGQTIGTDLFPTLGGPKVNYGYTTCDEAQTEKVYSNETAYDEKPGHSWSEWQETKPATGTSEGEETRTCTVCKLEQKRSIDKLENVFVDLIPGAYYETPVKWAVENGITKGIDETHFAPDDACNRAQIVTFLWRAAGSPEPASANNPFIDVVEGSFYYKAVLWAVENGIVKGIDENHFAPDAPCTRGQVVTFLWRFRGKPASGGSNIFTDVAPGVYYYDAVLWAVEQGITKGMGDGTFGIDYPCNRGQIVTFLYRTIG